MFESYDNGRRSESVCMNNKVVIEEIKIILGQGCYFSNDCTINSLITIEKDFRWSCEDCALTDTVSTEEVMCPFVTEREVRILK